MLDIIAHLRQVLDKSFEVDIKVLKEVGLLSQVRQQGVTVEIVFDWSIIVKMLLNILQAVLKCGECRVAGFAQV